MTIGELVGRVVSKTAVVAMVASATGLAYAAAPLKLEEKVQEQEYCAPAQEEPEIRRAIAIIDHGPLPELGVYRVVDPGENPFLTDWLCMGVYDGTTPEGHKLNLACMVETETLNYEGLTDLELHGY